MLSRLLPLLLLLACPLGMAAMMLGPALLRRLRRSTANRAGATEADPSARATTTTTGTGLAGSTLGAHR